MLTVKTGEQIVQELPWKLAVQGRIFTIGGLGFMFDAWDVAPHRHGGGRSCIGRLPTGSAASAHSR